MSTDYLPLRPLSRHGYDLWRRDANSVASAVSGLPRQKAFRKQLTFTSAPKQASLKFFEEKF